VIWAGLGADTVEGGSGNDTIHILASDRQADTVDCGDGEDTIHVNSTETSDTWTNCEHVVIHDPKKDPAAVAEDQ
jgi:Ca2+-binding RTX toxin-like protein